MSICSRQAIFFRHLEGRDCFVFVFFYDISTLLFLLLFPPTSIPAEGLYVFRLFVFILFHSLHALSLSSVHFSAILLDIIVAIPTVSNVLFSMVVELLS